MAFAIQIADFTPHYCSARKLVGFADIQYGHADKPDIGFNGMRLCHSPLINLTYDTLSEHESDLDGITIARFHASLKI